MYTVTMKSSMMRSSTQWEKLCYKVVKRILESGVQFDFGHFWEDICFKNGPLVIPSVFAEKVGPHYKKITELLREYAIDIVSLDCDGQIDALIPIWLENGVNTMFPIEVGTWGASIAPWREKYGNAIRGVGGMNKTVFAQDYAAVDREVERLKPLVALGDTSPVWIIGYRPMRNGKMYSIIVSRCAKPFNNHGV
ncbi:MAG: hypothetical protein ACLR23_17595 [Clostridia bacterium]